MPATVFYGCVNDTGILELHVRTLRHTTDKRSLCRVGDYADLHRSEWHVDCSAAVVSAVESA